MTIAEMIAALAHFDPDMEVVVCGFDESGFSDPELPRLVETDEGKKSVLIDFTSHDPYAERKSLERELVSYEQMVRQNEEAGRRNDSLVMHLSKIRRQLDELPDLDETEYLLSSPVNAERLMKSIQQIINR